MRVVQKILSGIGALLALILLFIVVCHFNPLIAQKLGEQIQVLNQVGLSENVQQVDTLVQEGNDTDTVSVSTQNTDLQTVDESVEDVTAQELEQLKIPENVAGRTGYQPTIATGDVITPAEAAQIAQTVGVGNTGEDLTYEAIMYPYYYMLSDTERALYRQIHANSNDVTREFVPVEPNVTAAQLENAFTAVCNDHPELFWLNTAYSYQYTPDGKIAKITLSYNFTANNLDAAKTNFNNNANEIIYGTRGLSGDYAKEVFVHNALLDKITYDMNAPINQSAYSALVQNRTVCAGYARAFQYIMQQLAIPCYYCTGYAGENHAWNIIKLEDDFYNVDTTWDDTNPNTYDYFNCTDDDYRSDHIRRGLSVNLPPCLGTKYRGLERVPDETPAADVAPAITGSTQPTAEQPAASSTNTNTGTSTGTQGTTAQQGVEQININLVRNSSDSSIINTIEDYYYDCEYILLASNDSHITFENTIINERLWNSIKRSYERGTYSTAYMNRVLAEKHLDNASITVTAQKLDNGTYRIQHDITLF